MWSVATEWQIYFVFALVLLPLLRRTNIVVVVAVAWLLGSLPWILLPLEHNGFWAGPWLLGSFALGMLGAVVGFSPAWRDSWWRTRAPWGVLTAVSLAAVCVMGAVGGAASWPGPVSDGIVSVFALCAVNACWAPALRSAEARPGRLARLFGSRALVYLGGFSYSLYLVQHPILRLTEKAADKAGLGRAAAVSLHIVVVVPVIVAVAWVFAELFERPFTGGGVLLPALRKRFRRAAAAPLPAPLAPAGAADHE
jgi:peptidoglycan/LPS O-acetylase OafA/YrhL